MEERRPTPCLWLSGSMSNDHCLQNVRHSGIHHQVKPPRLSYDRPAAPLNRRYSRLLLHRENGETCGRVLADKQNEAALFSEGRPPCHPLTSHQRYKVPASALKLKARYMRWGCYICPQPAGGQGALIKCTPCLIWVFHPEYRSHYLLHYMIHLQIRSPKFFGGGSSYLSPKSIITLKITQQDTHESSSASLSPVMKSISCTFFTGSLEEYLPTKYRIGNKASGR
jgi:hypothetical protein